MTSNKPRILYNVTIKIANEASEEWLQWMREYHIPDVMGTGFFESYQLNKILNDDPEGLTYAIQYICPSLLAFQDYQNIFAKALQKDHAERFKDKYVAFRTLMEMIEPQ